MATLLTKIPNDDDNGEMNAPKSSAFPAILSGGSFSWSWFSLPGVRGLSRQPKPSDTRLYDDVELSLPKQEMTPMLEAERGREEDDCMLLRELTSQDSGSSDATDSSLEYFESIDLEIPSPPSSTTSSAPPCHRSGSERIKRPLGRIRESLKARAELLKAKTKPINVEEYVAGREMTKTQERWNALSMIPPSIYCLAYLFTNAWLNSDLLDKAHQEYDADPANFFPRKPDTLMGNNNDLSSSAMFAPFVECFTGSFLPALPPLTILAVVIGTVFHMPCSFLYHWKYSHSLDRSRRFHHWSRRLDQIMIHFCAAAFSYASSGSINYFLACALFNLHCMYRHAFLSHLRPRSNQLRIGIAILAYSLPILRRGDLDTFVLLFLVVGTSIWLFSKYPIGGWSHCAFHLLIGYVPVIMMDVAKQLPVSQSQLMFAAQCAVLSNGQVVS